MEQLSSLKETLEAHGLKGVMAAYSANVMDIFIKGTTNTVGFIILSDGEVRGKVHKGTAYEAELKTILTIHSIPFNNN